MTEILLATLQIPTSRIVTGIVNGIMQGSVYAMMAIGLTIIFGVMDIINFSQAEFLMLGMYGSFFLVTLTGISPLIGFFVIFALFVVLGMLVFRVSIRPVLDAPEDSQVVVTFGMLLALQSAALAAFGPGLRTLSLEYSTTAFELGFVSVNQAKAIAAVYALASIGVTFYLLQRTDFGRTMRATANNTQTAAYVGINVKRVYMYAYGLGVALTASTGALFMMYHPVFPTVGFEFIILMFVIVVFGGLGSVKGALVAGLFIGILEQVAIIWLPLQLQPSLAFVLFLVILFVKPEGLFGTITREV